MISQSTSGGPLRVRRQDLRVPDHPESEEVAQGASGVAKERLPRRLRPRASFKPREEAILLLTPSRSQSMTTATTSDQQSKHPTMRILRSIS